MFVMFVRKAITAEHDGALQFTNQCHADIQLMFLGLIVFFIQVLSDLFEAITMLGWLYHIKTCDKLETLTYEVQEGGDVAFKHGLPRWYKILWGVPIVFAKITLMVMVTLYGSVFIAQSETNLDVILNCVALCFVFELDDYSKCNSFGFRGRCLILLPAVLTDHVCVVLLVFLFFSFFFLSFSLPVFHVASDESRN